MLAGITVPFVLLNDLFPFFRFGMFAEPVGRTVQTESFLLLYRDASGKTHPVQPAEVGLTSLPYLMRNYYYRGDAEKFLREIHNLHPHKARIAEWQLLRVTSPADVYRPILCWFIFTGPAVNPAA
jgi:hypothetical protein